MANGGQAARQRRGAARIAAKRLNGSFAFGRGDRERPTAANENRVIIFAVIVTVSIHRLHSAGLGLKGVMRASFRGST